MPIDGTFPTATAQWEKRNIALEIPVWDEQLCIQCGKCVLVCPHAVIRAKVYDADALEGAPATFKSAAARWKEFKEHEVHAAGCARRLHRLRSSAWKSARPRARRKSNTRPSTWLPQPPLREAERENWDFFLKIPETDRTDLSLSHGEGFAAARSRCSSSPAPAPAAAKRRTSSS